MSKENQRIVLTKRLLKEAIIRLLREKELKQITITELCREAEINRITFYRHYQTPRDVLEEIGWDMFQDIRENLTPPSSLPDFERYIEDMCTYLYRRSEVVLLLLQRSSELEAFAFIKEMYSAMIEKCRDFPELQGYDLDNIRLMTTYFGGGGYFLLRQWLTEDIQKTPREIASLVYRLTCNAEEIALRSAKILEVGITGFSKKEKNPS